MSKKRFTDKSITSRFLWSLLLLACVSACKKEDPSTDNSIDTSEQVNKWILDSMQTYYYWNSSLPRVPNLNPPPLDFFASIKNPADRFSLLVSVDDPKSYAPTLASAFGLDIAIVQTDGQLSALVLLVIPGSVAAHEGIKRGDYIEKFNNQTIGVSNFDILIEESISSESLSLKIAGKEKPVIIPANYPFETPIYDARIIDTGEKKTAYIFLNSFRANQVHELKTAFLNFKAAQATELIVDIRYNPGGEIAAAALLTGIVAPVRESDIFAEYHGNSQFGIERRSFEEELSYIGEKLNQLEAYRLPLKRVYLLTGKYTASSAELLVNNLSPYIDVIQIGEQTLGKDMASYQIKDKRTPKQIDDWVIYPMVYKLYNANGKGDYQSGLVPDIHVNELQHLPLANVGDINDPLIATALAHLLGKQVFSSRPTKGKLDNKILKDSRDAIDVKSNLIKIK